VTAWLPPGTALGHTAPRANLLGAERLLCGGGGPAQIFGPVISSSRASAAPLIIGGSKLWTEVPERKASVFCPMP